MHCKNLDKRPKPIHYSASVSAINNFQLFFFFFSQGKNFKHLAFMNWIDIWLRILKRHNIKQIISMWACACAGTYCCFRQVNHSGNESICNYWLYLRLPWPLFTHTVFNHYTQDSMEKVLPIYVKKKKKDFQDYI